ncbi:MULTISPECIES: ROK family transcriptional regulator [Parabacteroides]|uniref:ROK family protein (Putative glucokinase) n=1 Tax=Parabacteroides chinchillae TaxID=871327 RepID=A0A8G2F560_9BACT|nr:MULTISPECIES: ROK family transcriptional regulator [Parabacteroides]SEG15248.1 ROK family protein (putative glucokinase) [Parabacteroides chinchillae]
MATNFSFTDSNSKNAALKKRIIQYLILSGNSSIADISKEMELSVPTVTKLIMELLEDGYLLDSGKQNTNGGRKPNIYGLNPESGYFVGVDVQRKRVLLATIDFNGKIIDQNDIIPYILENTPEALEQLCSIIETYINNLPIEKNKILQVGVNMTGRINSLSGYSYSYFYFNERPLSQIIEEYIHIPVNLENDSRAMMYGEYMAGSVKGEKDILFININWGLGAGIITDGKLYYGKSGFSGEFGHISAFDNEIICKCGKKGCLETEASGYAIQRILQERYAQGSTTILSDKIEGDGDITLSDFVDAVLKEDVLSIEVLEYVGNNLGRWIAGLINIFNPELVILGGPISQTQDYIRLPIKSAIRKYSLNLVNQDTNLIISKLGERAGLLGACYLSRSKVLDML